MDRDEIHHKMSKKVCLQGSLSGDLVSPKVAQLTKVIFHLNTRNDEAMVGQSVRNDGICATTLESSQYRG